MKNHIRVDNSFNKHLLDVLEVFLGKVVVDIGPWSIPNLQTVNYMQIFKY